MKRRMNRFIYFFNIVDNMTECQQSNCNYKPLTQKQYESRINYLCNMQQSISEKLLKHNYSVQEFEAERDYFLNQLKEHDMVDKLKTACGLFDKVMYIDTETPSFIFVEVSDEFNIIDIKDEYDIVDENDAVDEESDAKSESETVVENEIVPATETKDSSEQNKLSQSIIDSILSKYLASRENICGSVIKNEKEYILFKPTCEGIIINNKLFKYILNNKGKENICQHKDELFKLVKAYIIKIGVSDSVDINNKMQTVIYTNFNM